ncbi:hypothetical protein PRZ48_009857 [Zasmidium cellare]|uniref:F-box domain-containing protein n=1 Tax=Zasmidium cellare TaxID=395010 RepID=A0ABR0ECW4_ZASCE|nr:hypothetical protein PRZ48_009857 [Zasmidium cellare]
MARGIFRFLDLPQEIRDMVYDQLVDTRCANAFVQLHALQSPTRLNFQHLWMLPLLLVNKQFKSEYFDHICAHHLRCYVHIVRKAYPVPPGTVLSPGSSVACLSKLRTLISVGPVYHDTKLDDFTALFNMTIPHLIALTPRLTAVEERLVIQMSHFNTMLRRGDHSVLQDIHGEDKRFKPAVLSSGFSRSIKHTRALYFDAYLCSDIETRKLDKSKVILYRATSMAGKEQQPEHLWYGLALRTVRIEDQGVMTWYY